MKRLLLTMACALTALAAHADTAIVVGVNAYAKLDSGAQLRGCVPDARKMAETLKKYGFTVRLLTDEQATRQAILGALKSSGNRPNERFVFYFAGHGTNVGGANAVILPADASMADSNADLRGDELRDAVAAVPAASRTIVLDSCFSGGMLRAKSLRAGLKTRFLQRPSTSTRPVSVNRLTRRGDGATDVIVSPTGKGICYVVAAAPNEKAAEDIFDNEAHGVFTHFLTERLSGSKEPWDTVMTEVKGKAADYLDDTQHPEMSPQFRSLPVFGTGTTPAPAPAPEPAPKPAPSLWELYNVDRPNAQALQILLTPDKTTNRVGQKLTLTAKVGRAGYLVVIERGTSGRVNLLWPIKPTIEDARTDEGRVVLGTFKPDQEGDERVKGLLFEKKAEAEALLAALRKAGSRGVPVKQLRSVPVSKDLQRVTDEPEHFGMVTSDIQFEVVK